VGVVAAESPVRHFIVHARKCLLRGLSAKENRTVPPLQRDRVVGLARDFPHLSFTLNGGVASIEEAAQLLAAHPIRGVMIGTCVRPWRRAREERNAHPRRCNVGRAAASTLHMFAYADARLFGDASRSPISRSAALLRYAEHARVESAAARNAQISDARFVRHRRVVVAPALSLIGGLRSHKPLSQWLTHQLSSLPAAICASDILRNLAARVAELEKIEAAAAAEAKAVAASQRATVHLASSL
jgi:tRNA-dihydrouridine synthase A